MKSKLLVAALLLAALGAACGKSTEEAELERLRAENERLRQAGGSTAPATASPVARHFANDAASGTLAGLMPGYDLAVARTRFGPEARTRSWPSDGRTITQYEWDLENDVVLRVNAEESGRIQRVAVVMVNPTGVNIPTLFGVTIGRETFESLHRRWAVGMTIELQLWGAQGLYTVVQRLHMQDTGRWLDFVYEMPPGLSRAELDRIGEEVQINHAAAPVLPYLRAKAPFMVALEAPR
ncbi:MAG: hypothetical protein ACRD5I_06275 [Candidatus Acidiferrales bacterium]